MVYFVYRISFLKGKILWIFLCSTHKLSYKPHVITSPLKSVPLPRIFKGFFPILQMCPEISCSMICAVDFLNLLAVWHRHFYTLVSFAISDKFNYCYIFSVNFCKPISQKGTFHPSTRLIPIISFNFCIQIQYILCMLYQ